MFLYNVTVGIDKDAEMEFLRWMRSDHMPGVVATGCFKYATIYKVLHDQDDGGTSYSVQFFAESIEHVTHYLDRYAPKFMEDLRTRFRDKHVAFMTLLEEV